MEPIKPNDNQALFETSIKSLEMQITNVGAYVNIAYTARLAYTRDIRQMADRLRTEVAKGKLMWSEAAQQAQQTRKLVMDAGLACGPGAPVCVTVGAFVGGALAAFSTGWIW